MVSEGILRGQEGALEKDGHSPAHKHRRTEKVKMFFFSAQVEN